MKIKLLVATLGLSSLAFLASADVSITGTLTSDYMFRGVSQTDSSPAVQVGIDYEHENGFFAGVWGSNVDFGDDANVEVDFFAGYFGEVNEVFSYDVLYNFYTYRGYGKDEDYDYGEFVLNAYYKTFTFTLGHASDYLNSGDVAQYVSGAYDIDLSNEYGLTIQAGYTFADAFKEAEFYDYSATVTKTFSGFDVSAAIINTDIAEDDNANLRLVLSASRTF
jgi:uncharacterized protein (TIGR02001 family)